MIFVDSNGGISNWQCLVMLGGQKDNRVRQNLQGYGQGNRDIQLFGSDGGGKYLCLVKWDYGFRFVFGRIMVEGIFLLKGLELFLFGSGDIQYLVQCFEYSRRLVYLMDG